MSRIGIFGGTFNPPHLGHLFAARAFFASANLDRLLVIPTFLPPHKEMAGGAGTGDRLEMTRLLFSGMANTEVSDLEIRRGGKSYTSDTLLELSGDKDELYFLCGTDMFLTLDTWHEPETIFRLATVAVIRRENDPDAEQEILRKAEEYRTRFGARLLTVDATVTELSSSDVRAKILAGRDLSDSVSGAVADYIRERGLYLS